ncbi:MAG: hypothetical protein ACYTEQ_05705 [Planctomycetota bacterium]|jgi:hypothetical protein
MGNGFLDDLPELGPPARKRRGRRKGRRQASQEVVYYVRPRCPQCRSPRVPVYDSSHKPVRYHKCSDCGHCFKSVER